MHLTTEAAEHTGKWKVETLIGDNWENVWKVNKLPQKFHTRDMAQQELDEHLADMEDAGMEYDANDFRIVPVTTQPDHEATEDGSD